MKDLKVMSYFMYVSLCTWGEPVCAYSLPNI